MEHTQNIMHIILWWSKECVVFVLFGVPVANGSRDNRHTARMCSNLEELPVIFITGTEHYHTLWKNLLEGFS